MQILLCAYFRPDHCLLIIGLVQIRKERFDRILFILQRKKKFFIKYVKYEHSYWFVLKNSDIREIGYHFKPFVFITPQFSSID